MPLLLVCPTCSSSLRVADSFAGKKVKCPKCKSIFTAEEEVPVAEEEEEEIVEEEERPRKRSRRDDDEEDERPRKRWRDDDEDEDRPRKKRRRDEDEEDEDEPRRTRQPEKQGKWRQVVEGLSYILMAVFAAIIMSVLSMVLFWPFTMMGVAGFLIFMGLTKLGQLGILGVNLYGHSLNLSPPVRRDIDVKGLSLATFICMATGTGAALIAEVFLLISLVSMSSALSTGSDGSMLALLGSSFIGGLLYLLFFLVMLAGQILFLLMLRGICLAFGDRRMAATVLTFLIVSLSASVGSILLFFLVTLATANGLVSLMFMMLCLAVALGILVWYIILLTGVRSVIEKGLRKAY